jgi:hypothetical protein
VVRDSTQISSKNTPFSLVGLLLLTELIAQTTAEHIEAPRITLPRVRKSAKVMLPCASEPAIQPRQVKWTRKALRVAAESFLGHEISPAIAATPNLLAPYKEDIDGAF